LHFSRTWWRRVIARFTKTTNEPWRRGEPRFYCALLTAEQATATLATHDEPLAMAAADRGIPVWGRN